MPTSWRDLLVVTLLNKSPYDVFMSYDNQIHVTKKIYMLHREGGGRITYLQFKQHIPAAMIKWASSSGKKIVSYGDLDYTNERFIKEHTIKEMGSINIYKTPVALSYTNEHDQPNTIHKAPHEIMAHDLPHLNLWEHTTTSVAPHNYRYGNNIPPWRVSLHSRHYDRDNEGYHHSNADRASLDNPVYGYDMSELNELREKKREKYQS